jgi:hypothetical protein
MLPQAELKTIIIMNEFEPFNTFKNKVIPDKTFADILYST